MLVSVRQFARLSTRSTLPFPFPLIRTITMQSSNPYPHHRRRKPRGGQPSTMPIRHAGTAAAQAPAPFSEAVPESRPASPPGFSQVKFSDLVASGKIAKELLAGIPFEYCSEVQAATVDPILAGQDVLARAKTGTGKTLAFLLPAIQKYLYTAAPKHNTPSILVIAPTRELAQQIEKEAKKVTDNQRGGWKTVCVVGGTNISTDKKRLAGRCDILVGTPGRLLDHLGNEGLAARMGNLKCLVLDEADNLLDQGMRRELENIFKLLPNPATFPRQNLLFSATISDEVKKIAAIYLAPSHAYISTVSKADESTHTHVEQSFTTIPFRDQFASLAALLSTTFTTNPQAKVICFFPTARTTGFASEVFTNLRAGYPVFEIHSRKSQSARTKATDGFRKAQGGVLFTSDVSARGIDIPGVTMVVQIGLPSSVEQYIHRLGRTARAGNEGRGLLILDPFEIPFLQWKGIEGVPIQEEKGVRLNPEQWKGKIAAATAQVDNKTKSQTFQAWLGYYKGNLKALKSSEGALINKVVEFSDVILQYKPSPSTIPSPSTGQVSNLPPLLLRTAKKMSLSPAAVQRLNVVKVLEWDED